MVGPVLIILGLLFQLPDIKHVVGTIYFIKGSKMKKHNLMEKCLFFIFFGKSYEDKITDYFDGTMKTKWHTLVGWLLIFIGTIIWGVKK